MEVTSTEKVCGDCAHWAEIRYWREIGETPYGQCLVPIPFCVENVEGKQDYHTYADEGKSCAYFKGE